MALATSAGRHLLVIASVCGTDLDPQGLTRQERILAQTGVMLESSNARAAMLAASIVAFAAGNDGGSSPALKPRLVPAPLTMSAAE
jgi:FdrA protein